MGMNWTGTITTASNTNVGTYAQVGVSQSAQGIRVFAAANASISGDITLRFALCDTTRVYKIFDAVVSAASGTTIRTDLGGSTGDFLADVKFADMHGGSDKLDLVGVDGELGTGGVIVRVGVSSAFPGSVTSLRVDVRAFVDV